MIRRNGLKKLLFLLGSFMTCYMLWECILALFLGRNLPINFDAAILQDFEYIKDISEQDELEPLNRYGYNVVASHAIKPMRTVKDTRHISCKSISSSIRHELPSTSVIIIFTDIDRSVLLRNVVSILTRTGGAVTIIEIILVDDGSEDEKDGALLSELPGVKLIRNEEKKGRGVARMQGVAEASGEIIAFVDCLAEVNVNWLSPLVLRLTQFPKSIVSPVLDWIDYETFDYSPLPGLYRGVFDWNLQFHWEEVPTKRHSREDPSQPYRSPALSGSVFAIRKDFFVSLGGYDPSRGARETEDIEFSFKAWMCGGQIEIIPCSRVGLIQSTGRDLGKQEISFSSYIRSARRVAEIWLEEYKRFFYATRPSARMQQLSDISGQRKQKEKLRCKSFKWFISAVYPQLQPMIRDEIAFGFIQQDSQCIDVDPGQLPLVVKLRDCDKEKTSQEWSWRKRGVIVSNGMCLTADLMNMQGYVILQFCKDIDTQIWYRYKDKIVHQESNLCLDGFHGQTTGLVISDCIQDETSQSWVVEREKRNQHNHDDDDGDDEIGML